EVFVTGTAARIIGAIDGIRLPHEVSGWARDLDGAQQELSITARIKSAPVAAGITSLDRPDLGGPYGFALSVPAADLAGFLATGELEIFAENHRLEVWKGL